MELLGTVGRKSLWCLGKVPASETMESSASLPPLLAHWFMREGSNLVFFPKLAGPALAGSQPLQAFQRCAASATDFALELDEYRLIVP